MAIKLFDTARTEAWSPDIRKEKNKCREYQEVSEVCIIETRRDVEVMQCSLNGCCEPSVGCEAIKHRASRLGTAVRD